MNGSNGRSGGRSDQGLGGRVWGLGMRRGLRMRRGLGMG